MWQCNQCKEFKFSHIKKCGCKEFNVIYEGEDHEIYAQGHHDAAEKFAKNYNEDGAYDLMNETIEITVIDVARDVPQNFEVGAEPDIYYSITEID